MTDTQPDIYTYLVTILCMMYIHIEYYDEVLAIHASHHFLLNGHTFHGNAKSAETTYALSVF